MRPWPLQSLLALLGLGLILLLRIYQLFLSPLLHFLLGSGCRFHPTCSEYAIESVRAHGPVRGSILALRRLGRCHPFHPGGYDPPVPRS